jgi:tetratricopeptide (TPR) repeat protein
MCNSFGIILNRIWAIIRSQDNEGKFYLTKGNFTNYQFCFVYTMNLKGAVRVENQILRQAEDLVKQDKLDEALNTLKQLEKNTDLTNEDQLTIQLLKSQIKVKRGDYEEGLKLAEKVLIQSQKRVLGLQTLDAHLVKASALEALEKVDASFKELELAEERFSALTEQPPLLLKQRKASLLYQRGRNFWLNIDPERAVAPLEQSLALYQELSDKRGIALCLRVIGNVDLQSGNPDRAIEHYQQGLVLNAEIGDKKGMAACLNNIGAIYSEEKGDATQAREYFQRSLAIAEELGNNSEIVFYLRNIGESFLQTDNLDKAEETFQKIITIHSEINSEVRLAYDLLNIGASLGYIGGEFNQSLEYLHKGLDIFEKLNENYGIALSTNLLGWVYQFKGELDQAIKYSQRSLTLFKEFEKDLLVIWPLLNLAAVYKIKGDFISANTYYQDCLAQSEVCRDDIAASRALYNLTVMNIEVNQLEEAKAYSQRLQNLYQQENLSNGVKHRRSLRIISQHTRLADALVLKASSRIKDKIKAQEIFQEVAEEKAGFDIIFTAMLHLCDSLLFEVGASGEEDVLKEAKEVIENLAGRARKHHSFISVVDTLIIQAKFAMVEGNLTAAAQFLDQAQITAEEKGLSRLAEKVSAEISRLKEQYDIWQHLIQSNASFQSRLEQTQLKDYLLNALKLSRAGGIPSE